MKRIVTAPRQNWEALVEQQGLSYHTHTETGIAIPYWSEGAYYEFSSAEIDTIEKATNDMHEMCIKAAERIIDRGWIAKRLALPESAVPFILASWEKDDKSLYGRMDFSYNPALNPNPKFLEYNGDTPTGLIEAAVIQWFWLQDKFQEELAAKKVDQFNSIHESLIDAWKVMLPKPSKIYFSGCTDVPEENQTLLYLADTASQSGNRVELIDITQIGWHPKLKCFWGQNEALTTVFKLYPWEDMFEEEFGKYLSVSPTVWIEPAWKILLANKAILPILWEMFPDHQNLLPAYDSPDALHGSFVKKPLYSREGANTTIRHDGLEVATGGRYADGPFICQAYHALPDFDGNRPVIGSWVINHEAHGLGIRESNGEITDNLSRFVPHIIRG